MPFLAGRGTSLSKKMHLVTLLILQLLVACAKTSPSAETLTPAPPAATITVGAAAAVTAPPDTPTPIPTPVPTPVPVSDLLVVRPGVYVTSELGTIPLPVSGYDVYLVGEAPHAFCQVCILTAEYLRLLQETIGLQDLILEEPQVYERPFNEFVLGRTDTLPSHSRRWIGILLEVRALNERLPDADKIRLHLLDVDRSSWEIYSHLQAVREEIGAAAEPIEIPSRYEFEKWSLVDMLALADQLVEAAEDQAPILSELTTVKRSIEFIHAEPLSQEEPLSGRVRVGIRESTIEGNIKHLLAALDGRSVLGLYGAWHTQKRQSQSVYAFERPLAQRLTESGVNVYSLFVTGIRGRVGIGDENSMALRTDLNQIRFADDTTLGAVLETTPDHDLVYIDLRLEPNAAIRLGVLAAVNWAEAGRFAGIDYQDALAGEAYDGIILFGEVTPVQDACP
jgi:hypothetical protein